MKKKLLEFIKCPNCKSNLEIDKVTHSEDSEIIEGVLKCKCGKTFLVEYGVPNFLIEIKKDIEDTVFSYDKRWGDFDYKKDHTYGFSPEERFTQFLGRLNVSINDLKGKIVLDAGCGTGQLAQDISKYGCKVIAMDISSSVVRAFKEYNSSDTIHYIMADVMQMPLRDNYYDYVWCHGVLMNVEQPKLAFKNLAKLVKKGGKLYTMYYSSEKSNYYYKIGQSLHKIISKSPRFFQKIIGFPIILIYVFRKSVNNTKFSKRVLSESKGQFYETFTTPYVHRHHPDEIVKWYENEYFTNLKIKKLKSGFSFSVCGTKS